VLTDKPFKYADYLSILDEEDGEELFEPLIEILTQIELITSDAKDQGAIVGIKGDWGVGKTSVLKAIEEYFKNCYSCPTVFFEAWKYQDEDSPVLPLLAQLRQVSKGTTKRKLSRFMGIFVKRFFYFGSDIASRMLTGHFLGESVGLKELKKDIKDTLEIVGKTQVENYSRFDEIFGNLKDVVQDIIKEFSYKGEVKEGWRKLQKKVRERKGKSDIKALFILIDDLDRLLPDKAIKLLEAIRFYYSIPNTVVIMGINDKILIDILEEHYRIGKKPYFSGQKFIEKLFHLSIELPHYRFNPVIHKIHFRDVIKSLNEEDIPEDSKRLLYSLDPLPHRKWLRIANKWEQFIINNNDNNIAPSYSEALFRAIVEECFPKAELFMRNFPMLWEDFSGFYNNPAPELQEIKDKVANIIENDNTFFEFPAENFTRLLHEWEKIKETERDNI